ncbi:hypothetical protein ACQY0O_006352 [Thecaphora frezii]
MIASVVRFSASLARQPAKGALASSTSSTAGIKTSASSQAAFAASPFILNEDGRLCSRNRRVHIYDPSAAAPPSAPKVNWDNAAARNKDARDLAGF